MSITKFLLILECPPGYAGPNCAYSCDYPTYGEDCLLDCACSVDLCDFRSGCRVTNKPGDPINFYTYYEFFENSITMDSHHFPSQFIVSCFGKKGNIHCF